MDDETHWGQVWLLFGVGLAAAAQFAKLSLTFAALAALYDRSAPMLALSLTAVSGAGIVLGALAGFGVARYGPRKVLIGALILGGILSLLQSLVLPFPLFIVSRILEGMAHLSIVVAAPVLMIRVSARKDYPMVMALWAGYFGVGFAMVGAALPLLLDRIGLQGIWALHGVLMLALAGAVASRLFSGPRGREVWPGFLTYHRRLYSHPNRVAPGLGFFAHTLVFMAFLTFLPPFIGGPLPVALVAGLLPLIALVGIFLSGILAARIPPVRLMMLSYAMTVGMLALLAIAPAAFAPWLAFLAFIIIGIAPGAAFAAIPALNHDATGQAEANGAVAQLGNLGTGLGSPLFALALGAGGFPGLLVLAALISIAGIVALGWISHRIVRQ